MKILPIIFTSIFLFFSNDIVTVEEIRDSYKYCNASKEKADQFYTLTEKAMQNEDAVFKGYHGAALALKASFVWNPFTKLSYFNKGKKMIDEAIASDPGNIELRMIRLSIQSNAPKIAGYYKNIDEDKMFLIENVESSSPLELKKYIKGYISHAPIFTKP